MKKYLDASTLTFINDLQLNNQREWFEPNRHLYEAARQDLISFLKSILTGAASFEPAVEGQEPKNLIFRIYRDVRFSKDKRPYKDHFGAYIANGGRKSIYPGYYLHISPNDHSFLAGGVWMPPAPELKAIRQEIDYNYNELLGIINDPGYRKYFSGITGEKLKTNPKGYDGENPAIEYLRHKSWNAIYPIPDSVVTSEGFYDEVLGAMQAVKPLNNFLYRAMEDVKAEEV